MPTHNNIVLIDLDIHSSQRLQVILEEIPGTKIFSENKDLNSGINLIRKIEPVIVILSLFPSEESALLTATKISQKYPEVTLFVTAQPTDSKTIIRAMRAGAREFIVQPVNKEELITAVKNILRSNQDKKSGSSHQGKMISLMGAKGGVGTTTVATNIAIALKKNSNKEVLLIDLNLQFGNSAVMLDVRPKYTLTDIANSLETLDPSFLRTMLDKNETGVKVLGGPNNPEDAEMIQGLHIEKMLMLFRSLYDYIVIDTHMLFDDVTIRALDESDIVLLLSQLNVPTVVNTVRCLKLFQRMEYDNDKIRLVLNRYPASSDAKVKAMEKLFDYPVFWKIPDQKADNMNESINLGIPITDFLPETKISQNLFDLAGQVNGGISKDGKKVIGKNTHSIFPKFMKVVN
ncbi:AAA family ATPase [candidate division KSB1 bacterium]|nr:AAA family ATPase [candidate division KSB1 bacterium]